MSIVRLISVLGLGLGGSLIASHASAQEQNIRTGAAPSSDATTAQVVAEARLKAAQAEDQARKNGLLANNVTNGAVSTGCNMQVGGQQTDRQTAPPQSLVGTNGGISNKNTTVVLGATVLLCNRP